MLLADVEFEAETEQRESEGMREGNASRASSSGVGERRHPTVHPMPPPIAAGPEPRRKPEGSEPEPPPKHRRADDSRYRDLESMQVDIAKMNAEQVIQLKQKDEDIIRLQAALRTMQGEAATQDKGEAELLMHGLHHSLHEKHQMLEGAVMRIGEVERMKAGGGTTGCR